MKYRDLSGAFEVYAKGGNVTEYLRAAHGHALNTEEIIEIAYDLQAGSYIAALDQDRDRYAAYAEEVAAILRPCAAGARRVLDAGTGECTSLAHIFPRAFPAAESVLACDLSWSRLFAGAGFLRARLDESQRRRVTLFVGTLFALPLRNKSIDVVWTSHAVEPNGGRERAALEDLFRVARKRVCLFEPYYERNSAEGQRRMERLGYIRSLPDAIKALGARLDDCIEIAHPVNPLNPTYGFIITPPAGDGSGDAASDEPWACPATGQPLAPLDEGTMFCARTGLAYPILRGIPVLRAEAGVLATALREG